MKELAIKDEGEELTIKDEDIETEEDFFLDIKVEKIDHLEEIIDKTSTYHLVKFTEEEDEIVAVVHKNWIVDNKCRWPSGPTAEVSWLKTGFVDESWHQYPIMTIFSTNCLDEAKERYRLYQKHTETASDSEQELCKSQMRQRKRLHSEDKDMENCAPSKAIKHVQLPTVKPAFLEHCKDVSNQPLEESVQQQLITPDKGLEKTSLLRSVPTGTWTQESFGKEISNILENLMIQREYMLKGVMEIKALVDAVKVQSDSSCDTEENKELFSKFPLKCKEEFLSLNEALTINKKMKVTIVDWLESRGGFDIEEVIRICMTALFSPSLFLNLNWTGKTSNRITNDIEDEESSKVEKIGLQKSQFADIIKSVIYKRDLNCSPKVTQTALRLYVTKMYNAAAQRRKRAKDHLLTINFS